MPPEEYGQLNAVVFGSEHYCLPQRLVDRGKDIAFRHECNRKTYTFGDSVSYTKNGIKIYEIGLLHKKHIHFSVSIYILRIHYFAKIYTKMAYGRFTYTRFYFHVYVSYI